MYGSNGKNKNININIESFDVVIAGGGTAGVSASIYSARKVLSVAIIAE
ncbi:MAG: hypothetical protein Q4F97_04795 [Bacteroidales bacterium]|nr:hypothetical protein [Bacteroidales bacterium]